MSAMDTNRVHQQPQKTATDTQRTATTLNEPHRPSTNRTDLQRTAPTFNEPQRTLNDPQRPATTRNGPATTRNKPATTRNDKARTEYYRARELCTTELGLVFMHVFIERSKNATEIVPLPCGICWFAIRLVLSRIHSNQDRGLVILSTQQLGSHEIRLFLEIALDCSLLTLIIIHIRIDIRRTCTSNNISPPPTCAFAYHLRLNERPIKQTPFPNPNSTNSKF